MSEATLTTRVQYRMRKYGWKYAHAARVETPQGWRTAMAEGWPDLFLMRERDRRVLVIELKRELEEPDEKQLEWLYLFNLVGIPAIVVKPSHLRDGKLRAVLK